MYGSELRGGKAALLVEKGRVNHRTSGNKSFHVETSFSLNKLAEGAVTKFND